MSVLMGAAMHAIQFNHLRHHAHCMDDEDVEAFGARLPAHKALLYGPYFPWLLHRHAFLHGGPRVRRFLALELGLWLALVALALALTLPLLRFHLGVMLVGQCLTAFFAVWTVHHDCDCSHYIARTILGPREERADLQHVLPRGAPPVSTGAHLPPAGAGAAPGPAGP